MVLPHFPRPFLYFLPALFLTNSPFATLHYNSGLEVDAIVERGDGAWAAFEVKLGQRSVDQAAASLLAFRERVDATRCGAPATLGVIVATGYGYLRDDGVAVIPIGALAP